MAFERILEIGRSRSISKGVARAFARVSKSLRAPKAKPERAPDIRQRVSAFSTGPIPGFLRKEGEGVIKLQAPEFTAPITFASDPPVEGSEVVTFDQALETHAMDASELKQAFTLGQGAIPDDLFSWFSKQGFIGYQACAIISQHWLVNKALMVPAKDAVRNGYTVGSVDGSEIDLDVLSQIRAADRKYNLPKNLVEFATNTRRFGIRLALFVVESPDEDYYRKPFNIDGVRPGSYKGISQVDPSWIAPVLDQEAAANPASMSFYEPTYWMIAGQLYHHSHLVIARYVDPPDILKPTYQYGGIPLTQLILERVYAAERTANEAPMLVETKRLNVIYTDIAKVTANPRGFQERLEQLIGFRNNYGVFIADLEDRIEHLETALSDLDAVIMGQYQLVAGVSEVPATKLIGTPPKGFSATGEFELESYYDLLENIQTDLSMLVNRHHELLIRSEKFGDIKIEVVWNPTSSPSAKEQAEINLIQSQEYNALLLSGAIDANDIRKRLIADPKSGFTMLTDFADMEEFDEGELDFGDLDGSGFAGSGAKAPEESGKLKATEPDPDPEPEEESAEEDEPEEEKPKSAEDARGNLLGYVLVFPSVETGAKLHLWATRAGIKNAARPTEFHCTLADSVDGIEDYQPKKAEYKLTPTGEIGLLGDLESLALVLFVDSPALRARSEALEAMGATSKFDEYRPHITLKYAPAPGDLEKAIAAYAENPIGPILMGGEIRQLV